MENDIETFALEFAEHLVKNCSMPAVSGSLLFDDEIIEAADEWVFEINGMKWSNNDNTAGDNFGSFIAGVKWVLSRFSLAT